MTAAPHHVTAGHGGDGDDLLAAFLALDTPEGFRAELVEGEIVVTPPPDGDHETVIGRIVRQVYRSSPEDIDFAPNKGLSLPAGRFIPDGTFARRGAFAGRPSWAEPDGVLLVLEVTSTRPERDRDAKRRGYAAAGIPLYLLVDRERSRAVLHSEPRGGDYHRCAWVALGDVLELPAPFSLPLDTGDLD
ncbi:Uma2 family endonuclease [Streptomyces sp. NPDC001380]|uniref:Uma2 family endonuclease n=1 Tax=Streptomyces sp. NPDC001380 TaxID=3364566 RepID=UPI0036755DA3